MTEHPQAGFRQDSPHARYTVWGLGNAWSRPPPHGSQRSLWGPRPLCWTGAQERAHRPHLIGSFLSTEAPASPSPCPPLLASQVVLMWPMPRGMHPPAFGKGAGCHQHCTCSRFGSSRCGMVAAPGGSLSPLERTSLWRTVPTPIHRQGNTVSEPGPPWRPLEWSLVQGSGWP